MWSKLSGIYLVLWLIGSLAIPIHFGLGKGKAASGRTKHLWVLFIFVLGGGLPLLDHAAIVEKWQARSFSGKIVSDEVTTNHRLHRYRIEGARETTEFLDELWEMKDFTTGDWVEKSAGSREVRRAAPGP